MSKVKLFYYASMAFINIIPFIPMSIKGILGLVFIIISCMKFSYRDGLYTGTLWVVCGFVNFFLGINVDYKHGLLDMIIGTALYYFSAYLIGGYAEKLRQKNAELSREIHRREKTEKVLNEKLTILQSLMDTIPSPIFFKDMNLRYIGCNSAYEKAMGISSAALAGKTVNDIADPELAATYDKMDAELLANSSHQVYETWVKLADGSFRNMILNKAIFMDERKQPAGIVGVMTDITEKKVNEMLLKNMMENRRIIDEMLETDKTKTEFFANISHELRTPLNVILGSVQLLDLYTKDDLYHKCQEKVHRNTGIMRQNCYRLLRLVNNLIDITRIDANAFELHLSNCNIISIIEEITLSISEFAKVKGIELVFDTDTEEKIIACDEEKVERIMLNLLSNAVKFTPHGGRIEVNVCDSDSAVSITVSDNGIGIPCEKQADIFKRFCQIDDMLTRQHEGSGIGLNLAKSLIEMHGGTIEVESRRGGGCAFTFRLPAKKVDHDRTNFKSIGKQAYVERVQVEFSDIYSVN